MVELPDGAAPKKSAGAAMASAEAPAARTGVTFLLRIIMSRLYHCDAGLKRAVSNQPTQ
jgi:hypothetical protein